MYSLNSSMGSLFFQEHFSMLREKRWDHEMETVPAIRDRILHLCAERNITINKLSAMSAIPPSSVKNILYGRSQDPKILTIKKICDGLDITLVEFFNSPEFASLEPVIK